MFPGGININVNNGPQNIYGQQGCHGQQGGPMMGSMMRMMQMMLQLMSQMTGMNGQSNCGYCPGHNPNFGCGNSFQPQFGGSFQMGANISAFLG